MRILFSFLMAAALAPAQDYKLGPDSERQPGVPAGKVMKHSWTSKIFPGTTRDYWVYVPAQYTADKPAAVIVMQDGRGLVDEKGRWRFPIPKGGPATVTFPFRFANPNL